MLTMMLHDRAGMPAEERDALERALAPLRRLDEVVRWGFARSPPRSIEDVVVQDEFTHDVLMPLDGQRWLVFDTT